MQNAEEWDLNCYLRDVAEEVAKYTFNTSRYPTIQYLQGDISPETQIETNTDGVLYVYIPQNFDRQEFQQALQGRIANGSDLMYGGQSPCQVRIQPCTKAQAENVQKNIHKLNNENGTTYYRLIRNSDDDFYLMTCTAPTPQIKQQIQRQFAQSNGYYSQTDADGFNSSESLSNEDKYLTALKMYYITGIMPQPLPEPEQDDEEQAKLYYTCKLISDNPYYQNYRTGLINNILPYIHNEQFDLDDRLKAYANSLNELYKQQAIAQAAPMQTVQPISQVPVPVMKTPNVMPPIITTANNNENIECLTTTYDSQNINEINIENTDPNNINFNANAIINNNENNNHEDEAYINIVTNNTNNGNELSENNINLNNTFNLGNLNDIGYDCTINGMNNGNSTTNTNVVEQYNITDSLTSD